MTDYKHVYINGAWELSSGVEGIAIENPTTEQIIGSAMGGTAADVDAAVSAARNAFPAWSQTSRPERARLIRELVAELKQRSGPIAEAITREVGTPIRISGSMQTGLPITVFDDYADLLEQPDEDETIGNSLVVREAAGVVGAITPWNYPLAQAALKLAPALAAGCTVVLKPSEVAPSAAFELFEAFHAAGFPAGVVNLVTGYGPVVGETLAAHPDVDVISFTGSVTGGSKVAGAAASSVKRVTLELGGKSANVILDDADIARAVKAGLVSALLNTGQTCAAWSRMIVPAHRQQEILELLSAMAATFTPGDPADPATRLGPVVSRQQRERVRAHIAGGIAAGATLVIGGADSPAGRDVGYFVQPTVFGDVDPDSAIAQEEIFGPVLVVIPYQGEDQALEIANNSQYGLHGAVWSADQDRAVSFARQMRTGNVDVNGGAFNPLAPFGGYKKSGYGREKGRHGLEEFREIKSIQQ